MPHISVSVPTEDTPLPPGARELWKASEQMIAAACVELGDDMAFSVILSRVTRELRRRLGVDGAAQVLRQLADTMPDVAKFDV